MSHKFHMKEINAPAQPARQMPRFIAFYLTQFHPTPENDRWWGKGFTEWTNVTKAKPQFDGHYQPHLPTDFGFYDLRVRETRRDQIRTAKQYGIDGFCYHYYWFSGKRILHQPLDDMLDDPQSDMPFCLCWANENWTRRWDGAERAILIAQKYTPDDALNFINSLIPFFKDSRYIRIDSKPLLIVYQPQSIPDIQKTLETWREHCRRAGIGDIHLCAALTHGNENYVESDFDSGVEFPPHNIIQTNSNEHLSFHKSFSGNVMQYSDIAKTYLNKNYSGQRIFKTVFPSWDNTARMSSQARIILNGTPGNYECWLSSTIDLLKDSERETFIFINAWNEWAEGCHLEPDRQYGHGFLQATLRAKSGARRFSFASFPDNGFPETDRHGKRIFWNDAAELLQFHGNRFFCSIRESIKRNKPVHRMLLPLVRMFRRLVDKFSS